MSKKVLLALIIFVLISLPLLASAANAISPAVKEMAKIMMTLNHYPTPAEKETLNKLIKSNTTTDQERILAKTIINLQHKASASDKDELMNVINNNASSENIKTLARIIHNLNHSPSPFDHQQLKAMAQ